MRYFHYFPGAGFFWLHLLGSALMSLLWLGLLGLLIWAIVRLARSRPAWPLAPQQQQQLYGQPPAAPTSALEILRQRYARGEIDDTTYHQMLEHLAASEPASDQSPYPNQG